MLQARIGRYLAQVRYKSIASDKSWKKRQRWGQHESRVKGAGNTNNTGSDNQAITEGSGEIQEDYNNDKTNQRRYGGYEISRNLGKVKRDFEDSGFKQELIKEMVGNRNKTSIISPELKKIKPLQFETGKVEGIDNISMTQNFLKSINKPDTNGEYFNPENSRLNLKKDNAVLFNEIVQGTKNRVNKRFIQPSKKWRNDLKKYSQLFTDSSIPEVLLQIEQHLKSPTISPTSVSDPINVGDLVTLQPDSLELHMIVSVPKSLESNHYTVISIAGNILFIQKNFIKYRFPNIIPQKFHPIIESLVQLEQKYLDIAPIGVPDSKFSRSISSLPLELQKVKLDSQQSSNIGEATIQEESEEFMTDYLVAQASSQLLTNTNVNTFQVPIEARKIYSPGLTELSNEAFKATSDISSKLELLHRFFQYDENGDLINIPRSISIFDILHYLKDENYRKIHQRLNTMELKCSNLGKTIPENIDSSECAYPISTYLGLLVTLRKQSRSWNIEQFGGNIPLTITVFPITNIESTENTINYLKFRNGNQEFANYCLQKMNGKTDLPLPPHYRSIVQLFKDYVIANVNYDPKVQTLLVSILRLIETGTNSDRPYKYSAEFARARSYDLILELEGDEVNKNPIYWSMALSLPKSEVNTMSELSYEYYDYINESLKPNDLQEALENPISKLKSVDDSEKPLVGDSKVWDDFYLEDPLAQIRKDFGDVPVYCIDSADAHEIDDGISIEHKDDDYVISVHVANPTSYIKPDSTLASIAFNKSTTTYLPEGPTTMLPKFISTIAGLGVNGRSTRTFVIQYRLNKELIDGQIKKMINSSNFKVEPDLISTISNQIKKSTEVFVSTARNFPQNFTYDKVDELLSDELKIEKFKQGTSEDIDFNNLFKLSNISNLLRELREASGSLYFANEKKFCQVNKTGKYNQETKLDVDGNKLELSLVNSEYQITRFQEPDNSQSVKLVTEMMIFANNSLANFAAKNNISIIYRAQEMNLNSNVAQELKELMNKRQQTGEEFTPDQKRKIYETLTSAKLVVAPKKHESIGLNLYAWSTSPLRRFVDMVNHWKIEQFLLNQSLSNSTKSLTKDSWLDYVVNHLQTMTLASKKAQNFSYRFWDGIILREYLELLNQGKIEDPIEFQLLIKSDPKLGNYVSVDVVGFTLKARIEVTPSFMTAYEAANTEVGQIFTSERLKITTIDFIEGEIIFEHI